MGILDKAKGAASSVASIASEKMQERRQKGAEEKAADESARSAAPRLLMTLKGSHIKTREWRPNRVHIFEDRVEEVDPGFINNKMQVVHLDRIAQVYLQRGVAWTEVSIESTGGAKIVAKGLNKGEAKEAKELLDRLIANARNPQASQASTDAPKASGRSDDIPAQIRKLAELRDAGLVSESEFESKKTELLSRM
jgi:hypothetical protein